MRRALAALAARRPLGRRALVAFVLLALAAGVAGALAGRGGDDRGGAAALAPPDAVLWARASTGTGDDEAALWRVARRSRALAELAAGVLGPGLDLERDVRPWLGDELAIAVPADGGTLVLAAVADRPAAERFAGRLPEGTASAFAGDYLALGDEEEVQAAEARADGDAALADSDAFRRAAGALEGGPVELYAPAAGLRELLPALPAPLRAAAAFADSPRLQAVAAHARPASGGLRVTGRVLRAPGGPPAREFAPALTGRVAAGVAAYLGLPSAIALVDLLEQGGAQEVLEQVRATLPRLAGVDLDRDLVEPLSAEAGVTVAARETTPEITLTARTTDPDLTREALARIQGPLAELVAPGTPGFNAAPGGGEAYTLPVTAQLQPSYAVQGNVLVASTAESGLAQRAVARRGIVQERALAAVMDEPGDRVEALAFADLRQLLALADRTGLAVSAGPRGLGDDLRRVRAVGAVVKREESDSTVELFLEIP